MKNITKKSRRSKRNRTSKYVSRGGTINNTVIATTTPVTESVANMGSQSLQQLQELKNKREEKSNEIMNSVNNYTNLAKATAVKTLGNAVSAIGIDINNPENVDKTLDNLKKLVTDPKNIEKTKDIISAAANNAAVYFKAAEPLILPLTNKMFEVGSKAIEKAGETATVIASNTIKEIPGVGLAYAVVQDVSKVGEAVSAATDAFAEVTTSTADSAVVFKKNLEQLQKEKDEIEKRTMNSLNTFQNPIKINPISIKNPIPNPIKNIGGSKPKSKRVRFAS